MAHFPPWPPAAGSPSAHPSNYPPPPPLPPSTAGQTMALPPELQALNITPQQMAALLTHLQAGTFPFPPPPPPPPPQSFHSVAAFAPVPFPAHAPIHTPVGQSLPTPTAVPSHMDIDREEGEVSDASQRASRVPAAPGSKKRKSRASQLAHRAAPQPSTFSTLAKNNSDVSHVSLQQKREAVLPFIAALHQEGFTFAEFVREGFEENLLRRIYQDLQLPVAQEQAPGAQAQALPADMSPAKTVTAPVVQPSSVLPVREVKPVVPTKHVAPMSRQDYLARLQAAKNKKAEAAPSKQPVPSAKFATPPAKNETATPPAMVPAQVQTKSEDIKDAVSQSAPITNKQSQTTELIRKKMEALKATQRRLANSGTSASPAPVVLPTANAMAQNQPKPTPTPPSSSFVNTPSAPSQTGNGSLIPGLRMSTAPAKSPQPQPPAQSAASAAPSFSSISTNSSKSSTPQPSATASAPVARKRPVASDLNEAQAVTDHHPFKRPFGRSRHNSFDGGMIIQVSDDDDTSDDDELSSAKRPVKASAIPTGQRDVNIRDLPPLRDFPQRSAAFSNQSGVPTPPLGTPGISSDAEELRRKELEITSLNQRIMEYEKRKAALKAKAHLSQSQPQTPQVTSGSEKTTAPPTPNASKAFASASAVDRSKEPADRRTELNAALTARNADIVDQKARILEMQRQVAEMQRQYDQDMENQQRLREELESLDVNTEGMTQSEMQAKKQEIDDLHEMEAANLASNGPETVAPVQTQDDTDVSMSEGDSDDSSDDVPTANQPPTVAQSPQRHRDATASSPGRARVLDDMRADRAKAEQSHTEVSESSSDPDSGSSMSESSDSEDGEVEVPQSKSHMPTDASVSKSGSDAASGLSKPASAEPESAEARDEPVWLFVRNVPPMATEHIIRSFFGAFDVKRIHLPRHSTRETGTGSGFVKLPLSQAVSAIDQLSGRHIQTRKVSIQMSKFEPQLPPSPSPEPSSASSDSSSSDDEMDISSDSDDGSDDSVSNAAVTYADQSEGKLAGASDATSSEDGQHDRMDLESSDESSEGYSPEPADVPVSSMPQSQSSETSRPNLADDLAPELQPTAEQQVGVSEAVDTKPSTSTAFKPYESVLKKFKGYRFHPDYPREVQGGYRSLTFNHQIDPNKELCRFEVARGVCNDSSCEYQHFRDMAVSDDALLLQMGMNGNPGKIAEYRQGLRDILQQMKNDGNLETEAVATRVAQYRRDFVQDPSNILGLI